LGKLGLQGLNKSPPIRDTQDLNQALRQRRFAVINNIEEHLEQNATMRASAASIQTTRTVYPYPVLLKGAEGNRRLRDNPVGWIPEFHPHGKGLIEKLHGASEHSDHRPADLRVALEGLQLLLKGSGQLKQEGRGNRSLPERFTLLLKPPTMGMPVEAAGEMAQHFKRGAGPVLALWALQANKGLQGMVTQLGKNVHQKWQVVIMPPYPFTKDGLRKHRMKVMALGPRKEFIPNGRRG
jgi:hypothetical protein